MFPDRLWVLKSLIEGWVTLEEPVAPPCVVAFVVFVLLLMLPERCYLTDDYLVVDGSSSNGVSLNSACISSSHSAKYAYRCSRIEAGSSRVGMLCSFWWWIRTLGGRPSKIQGCLIASSGVILLLGSQARQRCINYLWRTYLYKINKACLILKL